jgi:hypothetical protein
MMLAWMMTREKKMTGIDPKQLERRLRWAVEYLELGPQASAEEVRALWLRRLPADDFVPSSEAHWALAALLSRKTEGGWEARADEAAAAAEAERLRDEVEAFAQQFWEFPPEERRRRWEGLATRCAFEPALRARLNLLKPGLAVDSARPPGGDAWMVLLARDIREQFVLRPGPRAAARRILLSRIQNDRPWRVAALRLRQSYPILAALGNDLLDRLLTETPQPVPREFADHRRQQARQPATANTGESQPPWRIMWFLVVIAVTILRFAMKDNSSSAPPTYRFSPPTYSVPPSLPQPPKRQKAPFNPWNDHEKSLDEANEELKKSIESTLKKYGIGEPKKSNKADGKSP